ncbi:hypothetical protein NC653_031446 [Populus alba x Populus x berolinensis]|uniref:Uncharacterized protein n=1 Tax=Populus alba x Populus x berolinensis TaxID=444605 RepID=A0AAD6Q1J6_9ROSI|nr:hypothetical protein NC653_031446 [Populus alba x Populus x berolinensis]
MGHAPPAFVAEAASENEAERLEESSFSAVFLMAQARKSFIIETKDEPSWHLPRYWKLSLLVCPDKCSHPHAHQAFVKLNKSLKELYILYVETPHSKYL